MKKVLFRADANPSIGTGDLVSLISLSRYLEEDGWESFFVIKDYPAGLKLAAKHSLKNLQVIKRHISTPDEVDAINRNASDNKIDLLFFEITEKKLSDYNGLLPNVKKACVCFDGFILSDMDLVIDWDVVANDFFNPELFPNTKFLLGPEYVVLPYEFDFSRIKNRTYGPVPERLLVCMGGSDDFNLTQQVVDTLISHNIDVKTTVVVGAGYDHHDQLEQSIQAKDDLFEIKQNISSMFEEYMGCDVAIGAGGLTSSELVATRTPAGLIASCEHQIARCEFFHQKRYATYPGYRQFNSGVLLDTIMEPLHMGNSEFFDTRSIIDACNEIVRK